MQRKVILLHASLGAVLFSALSGACGQDKGLTKAIDPDDPRLTFSFAIRPGGKPLRFKVKLGIDGAIAGVSVYRNGETRALQELSSCTNFTDQVDEDWGWGDISKLIAHADLNFDGYQDLELIQNYIPHLDKKLYCVFLWDAKAERFVYSKELTDIAANMEAHPKNKTLTTRDDWMGGAWEESTYRWNNNKLELIEQTSFLGDWSTQTDKHCGFTFTCERLVNGKMVTTVEQPICTQEEMENLPGCPVIPAPKTHPASGQTNDPQ